MNFIIDQKLHDYYNGKVKQIFLYLTDDCQLRCKQCLYKPNLIFQMGRKEIPFEHVVMLMEDFYEMGARKVTFMGGEPFLYCNDSDKDNPEKFLKLIEIADQIGYKYLRADSNGQNPVEYYNFPELKKLGDLSFSIDGYNKEMNDPLRGEGSFDKCVSAIKEAVAGGVNVEITSCVHPKLVEYDNGKPNIIKMIHFAERLGVKAINFHVLFKHGFPMDTWTGDDTANLPEDWVRVRDELDPKDFKIKVRIPMQFITRGEFDMKPGYYSYCPVKLGERALIHPDGQIRVCSGLISSKYYVGRFTDTHLLWEDSILNEVSDHEMEDNTPCTNQSKCQEYGEYVPVCFSFKPYQKEFVWSNLLSWDKKEYEKAGKC